MFGDLHAATGRHQRGGGRDIVGVGAVTAGSARINNIKAVLEGQGRFAHGSRAGGDLANRFPAYPERRDGGRDLGGSRLSSKTRGEEGVRFLFRQDLSAGQSIEKGFERLRHGFRPDAQAALRLGEGRPASARKLANN